MDPMLPIILIATSSGGSKKNVAEAVIFSSSMIPEAPRTVLALTAAQDREREQKRTAEELGAVLSARDNAFTEEELSQYPRLEKLINLLPPETRAKIVK